jgi:hypothetical protein
LRLLFGRDQVADEAKPHCVLTPSCARENTGSPSHAPAQVIHALEPAGFAGDQAEHDEFVFGYVLERRERARAIVVVLE